MSSGDIWSTGVFAFESPLKNLLDSLDYTLEDLLKEDELLQELRGSHPQLIEFFSSEENVAGLVRFLIAQPPPPEKYNPKDHLDVRSASPISATQKVQETSNKSDQNGTEVINDTQTFLTDHDTDGSTEKNEASDDIPSPGKWLLEHTTEIVDANSTSTTAATSQALEEYEKKYIRFPYMACEVICCEVNVILDILVEGSVPKHFEDETSLETSDDDSCRQSILDLLFSMLFDTPASQLDDRRAGYLEKILTLLFRKKRAELTAYINGDHFKMSASSDETDRKIRPYHKGGGKRLLEALFDHIHSNSIAQIIQRLLMPNPPSSESLEDGNENGLVERECVANFQVHTHADDEDDDAMSSDIDDFIGINSDWADSDIGLELLLNHLIADNTVDSDKYPLTKDDEVKLNASQHACEILITVIQHSPLSSNVMKTMTGEVVLDRLMKCACGTSGGSIPETFSMHDSTMTTAMNVLEVLILQLGGYGTVPTGSHQDDMDEGKSTSNSDHKKDESNQTCAQVISKNTPSKETQAVFLIKKLPEFLSHLCDLLTHPATTTWRSKFQYSTEPQQMLGASRLRIVRLIESLVLLSIVEVDLILCTSDCLQICLDLFWAFPWCSMLHQSVANLLVHVLEGGEDRVDLQLYFLTRCNLPKRLMDSFKGASFSPSNEGQKNSETACSSIQNDRDQVKDFLGNEHDTHYDSNHITTDKMQEEQQNLKYSDNSCRSGFDSIREMGKQKAFRMGYMGHIIIICQALVHACSPTDQSSETNEESEKKHITNQDHLIPNHCKVPLDYEDAQQEDGTGEASSTRKTRNMVMTFLQANRHYSEWIEFVRTTLASETAVQTTPLGGSFSQEGTNQTLQTSAHELSDSDHYEDSNQTATSHYVVNTGEIDLDDADLDIAASMMESMNISPSDSIPMNDESSGQVHGHRRQRGVIGGHGVGNCSSFGTVVEMYKKPNDYVYDDPLGARQHFDEKPVENDSSDEECDGDETDEAPVMDLFAGNFNFDSTPSIQESDEAEGWANFDEAFGDTHTNYTSVVVSSNEQEDFTVFDARSDPFSANDVFGIVANSANIISSMDTMKGESNDNAGDKPSLTSPGSQS